MDIGAVIVSFLIIGVGTVICAALVDILGHIQARHQQNSVTVNNYTGSQQGQPPQEIHHHIALEVHVPTPHVDTDALANQLIGKAQQLPGRGTTYSVEPTVITDSSRQLGKTTARLGNEPPVLLTTAMKQLQVLEEKPKKGKD